MQYDLKPSFPDYRLPCDFSLLMQSVRRRELEITMPLLVLIIAAFFLVPFYIDLYDEGQKANVELCKQETPSRLIEEIRDCD